MENFQKTIWPQLRAVFVVVHLFAIFAMAFPAPGGGMRRSSWRNPTVQGEFAAWTGRLNAVGVDIEQGELEDHLWTFASGYMVVRGKVLTPFKPYYNRLGTWQSWRMFVAPHRFPSKLNVDIRRDGEWQAVYVMRDPQLDWQGHVLDHDRMRSALFRYAWGHYRPTYYQLCDWLAKQARVDFPTADRLRCRYYNYQSPSPQQVRDGTQPTGTFKSNRVVRLK